MPFFLPEYNQLPIHKLMLSDGKRVDAYAAALNELVKRDSIVVDIGSGTGIFSLIASKAGAKKVYAIERAEIAEVSKKLFAQNNAKGTIELLVGDSRHVKLPEKADIIVSEWMGVHVFQENMLPAFIDARDRFLQKGGRLIPESVSIWLAPLKKNPVFEEEIGRWKTPMQGFSFEELARLSCNDEYVGNIHPDLLAQPGKEALKIDLHTVGDSNKYQMMSEFYFDSVTSVEAICGWFKARLTDEVVLDTSPFSVPTHWRQTIYPFDEPLKINKDENLLLEVVAEPQGEFTELTWTGYVKERKDETFKRFSTKNNYIIPRSKKLT